MYICHWFNIEKLQLDREKEVRKNLIEVLDRWI